MLWTTPCQTPPSMRFSGKENWSGWPFPSLGALPDPGIEPTSPTAPALQVDSLPQSHQLVKIYLPVAQGAPEFLGFLPHEHIKETRGKKIMVPGCWRREDVF